MTAPAGAVRPLRRAARLQAGRLFLAMLAAVHRMWAACKQTLGASEKGRDETVADRIRKVGKEPIPDDTCGERQCLELALFALGAGRTISGVEAEAAREPIGAFIYTRLLDEIQ